MGVFLLLFQAHMRNMLVGWLVRRLLALSCAAFVPSPSFLVVVRCARLLLPLCFGLRSFCWCLGLPTFFAPLFLLRASDLFCGLFVRFCQHLSVVCPVLRCFWLTQTSPSGYVPCCLQQRGWALFGRSVTSLPSFKRLVDGSLLLPARALEGRRDGPPCCWDRELGNSFVLSRFSAAASAGCAWSSSSGVRAFGAAVLT